ncbi:uncharacterized protein LOC113753706 [Coffea eugenioides]|uniref:uncharacterized protein LOC113753706 n=1 Tax=Coffea eugenioides TaxID=49369 RepID=UPI000F607B7A|nr:uncharacterized protein LOC113753706 [Coffea eugenioides]
MSSSNYNGRKKMEKSVEEDEVDELLKAAQDDMLLKLSLNSHMTHSSSQFSSIDPDLDSRFLALKKPHQSKSNSKSISKSKLDDTAGTTQKNPEKVLQNIDESDDLFARFAALKSSLPSYNTSVRDGQVQQQQQLMDGDGAGEEDEVEKVIKWAIDAARLDPSPPSNSNDDAASDADDVSDDEEDDGHGVDAVKKSKGK